MWQAGTHPCGVLKIREEVFSHLNNHSFVSVSVSAHETSTIWSSYMFYCIVFMCSRLLRRNLSNVMSNVFNVCTSLMMRQMRFPSYHLQNDKICHVASRDFNERVGASSTLKATFLLRADVRNQRNAVHTHTHQAGS